MSAIGQILVIEDNPANLDLMVYLLQAFGYAPLTATDGSMGVETARRERPDLIICDVYLPKLDGYGVVRELKRENALRKVPILAVTALAMVGDREKMLAAGFDGYLAKPITPEEFVPQVEAFLPAARRAFPPLAGGTAAAISSMAEPAAKRGATILVVDDTPVNIEVIRAVLEFSGYRVLAAASVPEALAIIQAELPDLILCDLEMRPENGRDLLTAVGMRPARAGLPVVIVSSSPDDSIAAECLAGGAARFIKRPFDPPELLAAIESLLAPKAQ